MERSFDYDFPNFHIIALKIYGEKIEFFDHYWCHNTSTTPNLFHSYSSNSFFAQKTSFGTLFSRSFDRQNFYELWNSFIKFYVPGGIIIFCTLPDAAETTETRTENTKNLIKGSVGVENTLLGSLNQHECE